MIKTIFGSAMFVAVCLPSLLIPGAAQEPNVSFTFTTFSVPGAVTLSVEDINDPGTVSGYYIDSTGNTISFIRSAAGVLTTYVEPLDTTVPSYTSSGQINKAGSIAGEFYNTSAATYEGYVYRTATGTFVPYNVPGQPQFTSTGLYGINDKNDLCGFIFPPPYTATSAFTKISGTTSIFQVNGATTNACYGINNSDTTAGYYADAAGVYHGWIRSADGTITTVDVPGAATTPGTAPCVSNPIAGTVILGINNAGYVSGHYWDTSYNEHGFIRTPTGAYIHINVPGAFQTSGGGLNDHVYAVGHYADASCNSFGYIAKP